MLNNFYVIKRHDNKLSLSQLLRLCGIEWNCRALSLHKLVLSGFETNVTNEKEKGAWTFDLSVTHCCLAVQIGIPKAFCFVFRFLYELMKPQRFCKHKGLGTLCFICCHSLYINWIFLNTFRTWKEGKLFVFDDSFEHEVWHNGTTTRLVLIVDVWHPELTEDEKRSMPAIWQGNKFVTWKVIHPIKNMVILAAVYPSNTDFCAV